jgi:hypothetical protein
MTYKKLASALLGIAILLIGTTARVWAVQSPPGCNSNRLNLSIIKDKTVVQNGDTITYTVTVSNVDDGSALACDISDATANITLPATDGTATGTVVNLVATVDYPAGTTATVIGTVSYVVNVNSNVTDIVAQVQINGTLNDAPVDHAAEITKTIGTDVFFPTPPVTPPVTPPTSTPKVPNAGALLGF